MNVYYPTAYNPKPTTYPLRITYITQTRFPTEKAHGSQVAQVCHALSELGHEVTLLAPTVGNTIQEPAHAYYGLPPSFKSVHPGSFDALNSPFVPGFLAFAVSMWSYRRAVRRYLKEHPADLLYARSPAVLRALLQTSIPLILELHSLPRFQKRAFAKLCLQCKKVVTLTSPMRTELVSWGVPEDRILVEPDAVDLSRFDHLPSSSDAKEAWGLPLSHPIVGYVGTLVTRRTMEKGVSQILAGLAVLKKQGVNVFGWIVGGPAVWREKYEAEASALGLTGTDIRFTDHIPSVQVPSAIAACDICVYPAPASTHPFFQRDTSPLKMFEYMAARKPIVCADLPPMRDIVNESIVRFSTPGDGTSLASGVEWILDHPAEAADMAKAGRKVAEHHSWKERMKRILQSSATVGV
jgi:glycosyltransferase involved in cell wall biosynthesis